LTNMPSKCQLGTIREAIIKSNFLGRIFVDFR
jgi:hypothetical protein